MREEDDENLVGTNRRYRGDDSMDGGYPPTSPSSVSNVPAIIQQSQAQTRRKPVLPAPMLHPTSASRQPELPPRILGPRPLHSRNQSDIGSSPPDMPGKENINPRRYSTQPDLPPRPGEPPRLPPRRPSLGAHSNYVSAPAVPSNRSASLSPGLSVTLIRRDPSSSDQWNVGRLSMVPQGL